MGLKDSFSTGDGAARDALEGALRPGEQLLGGLLATRRSGLAIRTLAVGVTADRILLVPTSRKHADEVVSLERSDIASATTKGLGTDWRTLAGDNVARLTIESRTQGTVKLSLVGDDLAGVAVAGGPSSGIVALREFLAPLG